MQEWLEDPREAAGLAVLDELLRDEAVLYARRATQLVETARLSAELEQRDGRPRFIELDLAGTLRLGHRSVDGQLAQATRLVEDFPALHDRLTAGTVLVVQARKVIERTWGVSAAVAKEVDRRLIAMWADAASWVGARLSRAVTRMVLQVEAELDPCAVVRRHAAARAGRRVVTRPEPDGMGSLWALLPAEKLLSFAQGLDALTARQKLADLAAGVVRTADQRRADVLAELPWLALHTLSGAAPLDPDGRATRLATTSGTRCSHPRVVIEAQVPMATLLGHSDAPGHLTGYGPISAHQVRLLLPDAHLRQALVVAATGQVLYTSDRLVPPAGPAPDRTSSRRRGERSARRRSLREQPQVQWLGGSDDRPETLLAHLTPPGPNGVSSPGGGPPADVPGAADLERLAQLVPEDVLVLGDEPEQGYRPSAALQRLLRSRDELCTGPGCGAGSRRSDLDHADPWPHGPTNARNMRPHSRRCHRAKTTSWRTRRTRDGTLHWDQSDWADLPRPGALAARSDPAATETVRAGLRPC